MNARSDLRQRSRRKILVIAARHLLLWFGSNLGRSHMQIRKLAYATFVAVIAVAFVIGSAVPSEAAKKKKKAAAAAVAHVLGSPLCAGLREEGRPQLQLH